MPPAYALLAMAAPAPHKEQPFRFLDLPVEIRCMIYKLLMDRRVKCRFPNMKSAYTLAERATEIINCHYPAMMRVSKQAREEYTTIVMLRLTLSSEWLLNIDGRAIVTGIWGSKPILPKSIFSCLKVLNLAIRRNSSLGEPRKLL
jgi:hypothetical protein